MKFTFFLIGCLGATALFCFGCTEGRVKVERTAIRLGHAQYNPTNANFEWKAVKP